MVNDMKQALKIVIGFVDYVFLITIEGTYFGTQRFYAMTQSKKNSFLSGCAIALLESPLFDTMKEYEYMKKTRDSKLSEETIKQYSDDSLCGYGDTDYTKGGDTLREQQRGLILPALEQAIRDQSARHQNCSLDITEIGTGNGDVIANLAKRYPAHKFTGVDFSVKNAIKKYGDIANLKFVSGYALDLLESGKLSGDIIYSSSTFCLFTPKELPLYISALRNSFQRVVINEPSWGIARQQNDHESLSMHLDSGMWFHNYCGYFSNGGWKINVFKCFDYKHHRSKRPDIKICIIDAIQ